MENERAGKSKGKTVNKQAEQNDYAKIALELAVANKELAFQNAEKEKRAAELLIANVELTFQNSEKEKRAHELSIANQDLLSFTYVSSHDLQEPLRKIQNFISLISESDGKDLSETGKSYFLRISKITERMRDLIDDLLTYSRTKSTEHKFLELDLEELVNEVLNDFEEVIKSRGAIVRMSPLGTIKIIPFQVRQLFYNIIGNSFKFSKAGVAPEITISGNRALGSKLNAELLEPGTTYLHIRVLDNGIGFDPQYKYKIFEVFQRLHSFEEYHGTGIGLAICKRIVENHGGLITADSIPDVQTQIDIYLPAGD